MGIHDFLVAELGPIRFGSSFEHQEVVEAQSDDVFLEKEELDETVVIYAGTLTYQCCRSPSWYSKMKHTGSTKR